MAECVSCHAELQDGWHFCPACSAPLTVAAESVETGLPPARAPRGRTWLRVRRSITAGLMVIVALTAIGRYQDETTGPLAVRSSSALIGTLIDAAVLALILWGLVRLFDDLAVIIARRIRR